MPDYLDGEGNPIDLSQYEEGTILEDDDGNQFEVTFNADPDDFDDNSGFGYDDDDDDDFEPADERQFETVGKSAFGYDPALASVREALSKAVSEEDRDRVLTKAFSSMSKRAEVAEWRLQEAEEIAKSEQNLRLEREYISKAAEYNVPIDADELGPVLMRCATALSYDDCAVIHKALCAAGEMLYMEAGFDGSDAPEDPMDQIDAFLDERVSKSDGRSHESLVTAFFDDNPGAYDALRAERR